MELTLTIGTMTIVFLFVSKKNNSFYTSSLLKHFYKVLLTFYRKCLREPSYKKLPWQITLFLKEKGELN